MTTPDSGNHSTDNAPDLGGGNTQGWNWHPDLPIEPMPIFVSPPSPSKFVRWFARSWLNLSNRVITLLIAIATWFLLAPALERCREFEFGWVLQILGRNVLIMLIIAGGLHLYLNRYKKQGDLLKYDRREQAQDSKAFLFNNQVWDNMFWSLVSEHPVLFIGWIVLIPIWNSVHFYAIHRLLHHPALYKRFHALHHRNINIGPWAGISMHPVEHVFYFSAVCIHWVIASHPVHVIYNLQFLGLNAVYGHSGYENILINGKRRLALGTFYHQLHHRYFECNYGTAEVPIDDWTGAFHDGTAKSRDAIRDRRLAMGNQKS